MTKKAEMEREDAASAMPAFDLSRFVAASFENMPIHPLMMNPAVAMSAAAAIGFGISSQMAGAVYGMLQGANDLAQKYAAGLQTDIVNETPADEAPAVAPSSTETTGAAEASGIAVAVKPTARRKPSVAKVAKAPVAIEGNSGLKVSADDLKRISGIGPKLEQVLNGMGVGGYADIAEWTTDDIARIDAELGFSGRIARDDWQGQARMLMSEKPVRH